MNIFSRTSCDGCLGKQIGKIKQTIYYYENNLENLSEM